MEFEQAILNLRDSLTPQVTGRATILAAQAAAKQGNQVEAERLLEAAHELFSRNAPRDRAFADWMDEKATQ